MAITPIIGGAVVSVSGGFLDAELVLPQQTGLISGGAVTINADPAKYDVAAGTGVVMDWSNPLSPVRTNVTWNAFTAQSIPDITKFFTTIEIDATGALSSVSNSVADVTPAVRRSKIVLALAQHIGGVQINAINNVVQLAYNTTAAHQDYLYELGVLNKGNGATPNGANLLINKAAGTSTLPYINYPANPNAPTTKTNTAAAAVSFEYNYRNGTGGFSIAVGATAIAPNLYDNGTGVLAAVPNNKFTVQRVYYFPQSDRYGITYGQAQYSSLTEAQAAIFTESPIINPLSESGTFVTAIIVKKGVTSLQNTAEALFQTISSATSSGGSVAPSLESAFNVGNQIITNTVTPALILHSGAVDDTVPILVLENKAGVKTFAVKGNGCVELDKTSTSTGVTGAQTINKPSGSVNFAAGATSVVVTNSLVSSSSSIFPAVATNDATMKSVAVVATAGSFTLHANAAATSETKVNFMVFN